eukprot:13056576-Alexandrium_andersonii.AAC.1
MPLRQVDGATGRLFGQPGSQTCARRPRGPSLGLMCQGRGGRNSPRAAYLEEKVPKPQRARRSSF